MPASSLLVGDRRLEAATYLGAGSEIRSAMEARVSGRTSLGELARIWMPGRLKGIQVGRKVGTPFLAATQVFDLRPTPRKWLALERTSDAANRFVKSGTILVTCSGTVGRTTMAYAPHENTLISHDLLRIEPRKREYRGWVYASLHARQVRAMATGAQYGHIIKHLEVPHVTALPVPEVDSRTAGAFARKFDRLLDLRNSAFKLRERADELFAESLGAISFKAREDGFDVPSSQLFRTRRRLEASYYAPEALAILERLPKFEKLGDVAERVWWMPRFKRFYGEGGIPYLSADELFTINPPENKKILVEAGDSHRDYFVREDWIVMACSGQVYGMNGAAAIMTTHHENVFFSHDLIRIVPDLLKIRAGYLLVALTHPTHGRPLLIRAAYGTSIPHLDPGDVSDFPVARMNRNQEEKIADLVEESAKQWAEADALERQMATNATEIIDTFVRSGSQYKINVKNRRVAE